jgi:apolipoprotein N-acyltransferase
VSQRLRPLALAALSGVLYFVGYLDFRHWYQVWICLVPVLLALRSVTTGGKALAVSWLFGVVFNMGGYHWIVRLLETFAHLNLGLSALGYLLLCLGQGASLAAFGWLAWALSWRTGLSIFLCAPVAIIATELCFPMLFPSYLANSQAFMPYTTQIADLGGVLLVSGVITLVNCGLAEAIASRLEKRRASRRLLAGAALALVFTVGYSAVRIGQIEARDASAPKLRTAVVQANVGAGDKHQKVMEGIRRFKAMTDEAMQDPSVGLVVWPESALNRPIQVSPAINLTGEVATTVKTPMIVGLVRVDGGDSERLKIWNSAVSVKPGGAIVEVYDKTMLLAFGEYVPGDELFPGIYKLLPYSGHFERGASTRPLSVGPYKLATDICYEDILPRFIRALMAPVDDVGTRPHAMVNVTNDSWYGPAEPPLHLALATFRTIEHRRWLVRSTATGISAFIDSAGRVVKQSGFEVPELLVADVPMVSAGPTVYGVVGDVVGYLAVALSLAGLFLWRRAPAVSMASRASPLPVSEGQGEGTPQRPAASS